MKSSPVLNVLVIIVGALLFISGIMKALGMLASFELHAGDIAIKIPNSMSWFYIITVNLMGGGAMLHHAIATLRFKRNLVDDMPFYCKANPKTQNNPPTYPNYQSQLLYTL